MAKKQTWADVLGSLGVPVLTVPTSKKAFGPPVPKSILNKPTVTKTTVVRPPPPSWGGAVVSRGSAAARSASGGLVQAAADQAVPHHPEKPPPQPKKIFPTVKNPSPEQEIYQAQAARVAAQLPALSRTVDQRQTVAQALEKQMKSFFDEKGHFDKTTGKWAFATGDLKRARALNAKLAAASERERAAIKAHDDVITRLWELDRAYKQNTQSPAHIPEAPDPTQMLPWTPAPGLGITTGKPTLDLAAPAGVPGATTRGPTLAQVEAQGPEGGWLSHTVSALAHVPARFGSSLLPIDEGHLGKPEALQRLDALGQFGAVATIEGSKWLGKTLWQRMQEDPNQAFDDLKTLEQRVKAEEERKGRPLTPEEMQRQAAGLVIPVAGLTSQHLRNFIAGAGGVIYGLQGAAINALTPFGDPIPNADPVQVAKDIAKLGVDVTVGTGLLFAAITRPDLTYDQYKAMLAEMPKGIIAEYTKHFGRGLSMREAFNRAKADPVGTAMLYPLPVSAAAQGGRILVLTRFFLKGGKTLPEAIRLAREPEAQRMLTYTERAPKGSGVETVRTQVPADWSSSVLVRNTLQRPGHVVSRVLDVIPGARKLPIAMSKRAASQQGKNVRRAQHRAGTEAHAAFREVESFLNERNWFGAKKNKHYATTLAVLVQKPNGLTAEEMERAVIENLKVMLADPERMDLPGQEVSPGEQKLINRIARYDKKAEAARVTKRSLTMRRLYGEQQRMGESLRFIIAQRENLHNQWLALEHNPDLIPQARADEYDYLAAEIQALDSQKKVLSEQLREISVDQPEIKSAKRERARQVLEGIVYFQDYPQAIEDALLAGDAVARHYGRMKGVDPAVWWEKRDVRLATPEEIPLEAYAQEIGNARSIAAQRRRFTDFNAERDMGTWLEAEAARLGERGNGHPRLDVTPVAEGKVKPKKVTEPLYNSRQDLADLVTQLNARLAEGLPYSRHWYSDSGRSILDYVGGDKREANKIAALFAIYSPQKAVPDNLALAFRVYTEHLRGVVPRHGSAKQRQLAEAIMNDKNWLDLVDKRQQPKVRRFYANLLKHIDREHMLGQGFNGREVTADGWMGAAFGHGENTASTSLGLPQIDFIERTTQALADHYGLEPEQAQAAIWTSIKAERDASTKGRYTDPATREGALAASGESFADSLWRDKTTLRIPFEALTAAKPFFNEMPFEAQVAYTREIGHAVISELRKQGLVARLTDGGIGVWREGKTLETNPAVAVEVAIGDIRSTRFLGKYDKRTGKPVFTPVAGRYYRTSPDERRLFDQLTAIVGDALDQQAAVWARRFVARKAGDVTGRRVRVGRPMTREEMRRAGEVVNEDLYHITQHSDGFSLALNDPNPVLDRAILIDRRLKRGRDSAELAKQHEADAEQLLQESERVIHAAIRDDTLDVTTDGYSHRGSYLDRSEYHAQTGPARRRDVFAGLGDRLSGAVERVDAKYRVNSAAAADDYVAGRSGPATDARGVEPPLHQSRQSDTLGATQLINSATGERIIWLTEHADFSTVVHELLGHAAEEMKDLHPEEFAKVEQVIGRTLDQWTTEDHERFATWFERYLYEGHAPTPELVPVFDRAKQYMRVIYEQIRRALGGRIPPATRDLFEHYLGGWDSESSSRIAVNMGHYDPSDSPWAGARSAAQSELDTLQKRNRTRRYNQTQQGMLDKLKALQKKADQGDLNQEERDMLAAEIVRTQAEIVLRADKRVRNLQSKISDMEKALTRDPSNRRFSGALEAAKFMMEDRERILKEVFGDEYDEIFSNRRDLLANYLVQHGLLRPDFEHGTGTYFPMKLDEGFLQSLKIPMVPASNRVIGQVSKAFIGVHHRNEMIRWQAGDWSADPGVLQLAHARALSYQFVLEVRETMHAMGRRLTYNEQTDPKKFLPSGGYVINLKGTPLSPDMKAATRGMTNTTTTDHLDDGLFGDNEKLENTLKSFFENSVIDLDKLPAGFDLADQDLRFVSKAAVNKIFRPVSLNLGGKVWDVASTAARFALIYANVPGYMITNLAGNLAFLTLQQGLNWIPRGVWYGKMLANDAHFRARVKGEAGMLPAFSAITRGRNFGQRMGETATAFEHNWLAFESKVDEYPRMIAWMAEANKRGYWSKESMLRLLDGKTAKTARDREYVSERTNQHMIDFTYRVSDRERQSLGRLFFIWPYVRGATAMPFWYGMNYPARTALLSQLALQQRQYQQNVLGELPPGREDLFPISRTGQQGVGAGAQANVVGTRYYNPAGPLPDEIRLASDLVASLFGRTPDNLSARLASLLNVNVENSIGLFTGRDAFGKDISLKEQIFNPYGIADSLMPFQRYIRAAFDERYVPRALREGEGDTLMERVGYSLLRVPPHTVSVDWLNASAQASGTKTTKEKIAAAVTANKKHFHSVEGGKAHYPNALAKQVAGKIIYDDRVAVLEKEEAAKAGHIPKQRDDGTWDFGYHADAYDKAVVAYEVLKQNFPEVLAEAKLPPPNDFLIEQGLPPRSEQGLLVASVYNDFLDTALITPPGPKGIEFASNYETQYEAIQLSKRLASETKRGVYRGQEAKQRALRARAAARSG